MQSKEKYNQYILKLIQNERAYNEISDIANFYQVPAKIINKSFFKHKLTNPCTTNSDISNLWIKQTKFER